MRRSIVFGAALSLAVLVAGCGGADVDSEPGESPPGVDFPGGTYPDSGLDLEWPAEIPTEFPQLEGRIQDLFGSGSTLRLSYREVSPDNVMDYASKLEAAGFDVEYLVYASDVDPERAEERARRGEIDAIRASKGGYSLHLEFGAGMASLAISGAPDGAFDRYGGWPVDETSSDGDEGA